MPTVSVVIPAYNAEQFVGQAISSVLGQTYQDFEIIAVDDGSSDATEQAVRMFAHDNRVRYIRQENRGPSAARNTGLHASSGRLVAFLDADDLWVPSKLEAQVQAVERHPDPLVVYSDFGLIDDEGRQLPRTWRRGASRGSLAADLMFGNVIAGSTSSVLLPAECFRTVGFFDEGLWTCEDQDMWRRLALAYEFLYLDVIHVLVRVHASHLQADAAKMMDGQLRHLQKMYLDTPPALRRYLPEAAYATYLHLAFTLRASGKPLAGLKLLGRIPGLGIKYVGRLGLVIGGLAVRKVGRKLGAKNP